MSGSYYQLNQKYNQLLALIKGLGGSDLTAVLTAGDDAGGLDITNLNNINLTTINGGAYPPAGVIPTLGGVLGSGNDGLGQSITNLNDVALTTINGVAYPPAAPLYPYLNVAFLFSVASTYQTFTINRIVPNLTLGNPPNTTTSSRGTWTLTDTGYIVPDTGRYSISFSATSQGAVLWAWYVVVNGANGTATFDANNGAEIRYTSSRACNLGISTLTLTAGDIVGIKGTDSPTITQGQYWFNIAYIGA